MYDSVLFHFIPSLRFSETLGEGAFGIVKKAEATGLPGRPDSTTVAVKMLKGIVGDLYRLNTN